MKIEIKMLFSVWKSLLSADSGMYFAIRYFYKNTKTQTQKSILMGQKKKTKKIQIYTFVSSFYVPANDSSHGIWSILQNPSTSILL